MDNVSFSTTVSQKSRMLLAITILGGATIAVPLLLLGKATPWIIVLDLILLLPYLVVGWRLQRTPLAKDGPALAMGIGAVFTILGLLLLEIGIEEHDPWHEAYFSALAAIHALLIALAIPAFRRGTSNKPAWRILLRSFIDPIVYYGIVFFIAAGASVHLHH
jgi:hypothetical protein